jgi:small subunit ribosomal protein S16
VLKIRLKRAGGRNRPFYRVVVVDSRKARDSRALEEIGYYNPLEKPLLINVDRERVDYWKERGAQVTDSVKTLLKRENAVHPTRRIVEEFAPAPPEIEVKPKKKIKGKAAKAAEVSAPADEPKAEKPKAEKPKTADAKPEPAEAKDAKAAEPKADEPKAEAAPSEDAKVEEASDVKAEAAAEDKPAADKKAGE